MSRFHLINLGGSASYDKNLIPMVFVSTVVPNVSEDCVIASILHSYITQLYNIPPTLYHHVAQFNVVDAEYKTFVMILF